MAEPAIVFGTATASYPRGPISDWQTGVTMRRRPEQHGADVGTFGKEPRSFALPAVLFGTTARAIWRLRERWEAQKGQRRTLYRSDADNETWPGMTLIDVFQTGGIRRILLASNGANYEQVVTLVFARTKET